MRYVCLHTVAFNIGIDPYLSKRGATRVCSKLNNTKRECVRLQKHVTKLEADLEALSIEINESKQTRERDLITRPLPNSERRVLSCATRELDSQRVSTLLERLSDQKGFVECFQEWSPTASKLHPRRGCLVLKHEREYHDNPWW